MADPTQDTMDVLLKEIGSDLVFVVGLSFSSGSSDQDLNVRWDSSIVGKWEGTAKVKNSLGTMHNLLLRGVKNSILEGK
jgi:hypothetical protein